VTAAPQARHAPEPRAALVRVDDIDFHPRNVRRDLGDLRDLADSIARVGILQPVILEMRGNRLRLRAGHRRIAAARLAGLTRVPAMIHPTCLGEAEWVMQALHENTKRRDLDPAERADAIRRLKQGGMSTTAIADGLGVSVGTVRNWAAGVEPVAAAPKEPAEVDAEQPSRQQGARPGAGPLGPRPRRTIVSAKVLASFTQAWRGRPDATVLEVLDALDQVAATGRTTEALPPEGAAS
jgi:ParB/RepB/Spo0J family partition protein